MNTASVYQIFNLSLAQKYGVPKAIIIYQFEGWLWKAERTQGKISGRPWIIKPMTEIAKAFPYLRYSQVRYHILGLIKEGVIITKKFGIQRGYSFSDESMFINGISHPEVKL